MTDEIKQAFDHPIVRSMASSSGANLDRISLRDHVVAVEIGAFQAERDVTQRISFNIVVEVRHVNADLGDDVDLILSYDRVTEAIDTELAAERLNLLETLAERVADRILREPQAERVFVRIEKLDRGGGALGVEIVRDMTDITEARTAQEIAEEARVVYLSDAALKSGHLSGWIDQLVDANAPLVLVVPAQNTTSRAKTSVAQAHIDLLAIEQSAWVFCANEPRSVVVGTRTELDWAIKNNQVCVWAPSKFVMDAVESPLELITQPVALTDWFAAQIGACDVLFIGEELPVSASLPCRAMPVGQVEIKLA